MNNKSEYVWRPQLSKSKLFYQLANCHRTYGYTNIQRLKGTRTQAMADGSWMHERRELFFNYLQDTELFARYKSSDDYQYFKAFFKKFLCHNAGYLMPFMEALWEYESVRLYVLTRDNPIEDVPMLFLPVLNEQEVVLEDIDKSGTADQVFLNSSDMARVEELKGGAYYPSIDSKYRAELWFEAELLENSGLVPNGIENGSMFHCGDGGHLFETGFKKVTKTAVLRLEREKRWAIATCDFKKNKSNKGYCMKMCQNRRHCEKDDEKFTIPEDGWLIINNNRKWFKNFFPEKLEMERVEW